jgi:Cell Wall Hydrolase
MPLPAPSPMLLLFQTIAAVAAGHPDGAGIERQEALCLARNIYFEARGEDPVGQEAVASVTMNRVRATAWPASVCEVVYQPLQFSWTRAYPRDVVPPIAEPAAWRRASEVAARTLLGQVRDRTGGATHYVAPARISSMPGWVAAMASTQRIGGHRFLVLANTSAGASTDTGKPARARTGMAGIPVPSAKPRGAVLLAEIMSSPPPAMPVRARAARFLDAKPRLPATLPAAWTVRPSGERTDLPRGGLPPADQSAEQRLALTRRDRAAMPKRT